MTAVPPLHQQVSYLNSLGEMRPGKVIGIRHLGGYPHPVITVQTEGGWAVDVAAHLLEWTAPAALDRDELAALYTLAREHAQDIRSGDLSGYVEGLPEALEVIMDKLQAMRKLTD